MVSEKTKPDMAVQKAIWEMGGTDFHALWACTELLRYGRGVDPDAFGNRVTIFYVLDDLNIRGERMYKLWRFCRHNASVMLAVLRAYEMGQLAGVNQRTLNYAIDNDGAGIDLDAVVKAVKSRLPNFNLLKLKTDTDKKTDAAKFFRTPLTREEILELANGLRAIHDEERGVG